MQITDFTVEKMVDPTGILAGIRYEFFCYLELDEEDELNDIENLKLRALFLENNGDFKLLSTYFLSNEDILEFDLEEDEEKQVFEFCLQHYKEADEE